MACYNQFMNTRLLLFIGTILLLVFFALNKNGPSLKETISQKEDVKEETPATKILTTNLEIPWSLAFLPDQRMLVTERPGRVKLINNDGSIAGDAITISEVKHAGEGGLLGLALHPDFENNKYVYLYYTFDDKGNTMNKVVRYTFENDKLIKPLTIQGKIPGSFFHNGGRIKFGPDKFLYITTGDSQNESTSQDINSLAGKILRLDEDGKGAVYSYGHRNPQGLDWKDGKLYATEHGPSTHDEINIIEKGKNYGWPIIKGTQTQREMETPLLESGNETWAPSGTVFYKDNLFFAGLRGSALFEFNPKDLSLKAHFKNEFGRIRDVVLGPDNFLYILTNNRDGRGTQRSGDDKIIKINPEKL